MSDLVDFAVEAHGGLDRFRQFRFLTAKLKQGGILWGLKNQAETLADCNVTVDLVNQWASHWPFAPGTNRSLFTPERVVIESEAGEIVEQLDDPRASFAGAEMTTPWSDAQLAYFAGYAMRTYLTAPFILHEPGVVATEIAPWSEGGETWRRLRVEFPSSIATHSKVQDYYFDDAGMIRRHDYEVEIQGNNAAAHYLHGPVQVQGITLYSSMRIVPNTPENLPMPEPEIVTIDLSGYLFE